MNLPPSASEAGVSATFRAAPPAAKETVPTLIQALKDQRKSVRSNAAWASGKIGPEAKVALPRLIEILDGDNTALRGNAAAALARIGGVPSPVEAQVLEVLNTDYVPRLLRTLRTRTDDDWYRVNATVELGQLGAATPAVVPALAAALNDSHTMVRAAAAEALGKIGPEAADAVPMLNEALKHEDERTREAAANVCLPEIPSGPKTAVSAVPAGICN